MSESEKRKRGDRLSYYLKGKTYEQIHGIENADHERKKRSIGAIRAWENMDDSKKRKRANKISNSNMGKSRNFKEIICPYCNMPGKENIMYRWHFSNCKYKLK